VRIGKHAGILAGLAVLGAWGVAMADAPKSAVVATGTDTVVVVGASEDTWNCNEASAGRARWLADKASRDGAYKRAGECYLAAGEPALADEAFVKALGPASADTSRQMAANRDQVKAQARQLKLAFQHK
jgi:hypothetical protein